MVALNKTQVVSVMVATVAADIVYNFTDMAYPCPGCEKDWKSLKKWWFDYDILCSRVRLLL